MNYRNLRYTTEITLRWKMMHYNEYVLVVHMMTLVAIKRLPKEKFSHKRFKIINPFFEVL